MGSNPAEGMDFLLVCLSSVVYVAAFEMSRSFVRSFRGVLTAVCVRMYLTVRDPQTSTMKRPTPHLGCSVHPPQKKKIMK